MNQVADKFCKSSGKMAAVRRFFDRLGDNGSTFSAWLGLLPDGEYSSIVCGAFKMIIKVRIVELFMVYVKAKAFVRQQSESEPFVKLFLML